jgi:selT/selW/selH-like putative selenoprotein
MANYLQQNFGTHTLEFEEGTYPPGPTKELIGTLCGYAFVVAIVLSIGIANALLPNDLRLWVEQNRGMVIGAGFALNLLGSSLLQTGAFEIYLDGSLIFSKLETGHIPNPATVATLIRQALRI